MPHGGEKLEGLLGFISLPLINRHVVSYDKSYETFCGDKNSQIPLFFKITNILPLFEKYLTMYHYFETRVNLSLTSLRT